MEIVDSKIQVLHMIKLTASTVNSRDYDIYATYLNSCWSQLTGTDNCRLFDLDMIVSTAFALISSTQMPSVIRKCALKEKINTLTRYQYSAFTSVIDIGIRYLQWAGYQNPARLNISQVIPSNLKKLTQNIYIYTTNSK